MAADQNEKKILKGLKKEGHPHWISPMLATLTEDYFSDPDWIYEEKFDGMRCIAMKKKGKVTLYSRNHRMINHTFPEIVAELEKKGAQDYVVDGEVVALKGDFSSFSLLQNRMNVLDASQIKGRVPKVYYYLFDLMYWDEYDVRGLPLLLRKQLLKYFFSFTNTVRYTPHVKEKGLEFYKQAEKKGWEGIIAKKGDSFYLSRRSKEWLKFKCSKGQEFVIGGYTTPKGEREDFGALLIGYYDSKGAFHYAGKVGTGYSFETLHTIGQKLRRLETKTSPFKTPPKEKGARWTRPHLVCEIEFTEWTHKGKLRHPRFKGLRRDKKAASVRREKP